MSAPYTAVDALQYELRVARAKVDALWCDVFKADEQAQAARYSLHLATEEIRRIITALDAVLLAERVAG